MPLQKQNEPALAGARCVNCQQELGTRYVSLAGEDRVLDARDFVGYFCTNENCKYYGAITVNHRLPAGVLPQLETKPPAKKV